jgi:hypothetical protein
MVRRIFGGEGGIRTHGTVTRTTVFETANYWAFWPVKPNFLSAKQKNTGLWEENYPAGPGKKTTAI